MQMLRRDEVISKSAAAEYLECLREEEARILQEIASGQSDGTGTSLSSSSIIGSRVY